MGVIVADANGELLCEAALVYSSSAEKLNPRPDYYI